MSIEHPSVLGWTGSCYTSDNVVFRSLYTTIIRQPSDYHHQDISIYIAWLLDGLNIVRDKYINNVI